MNYHLGEIEARFADIIWENAPLPSRRLAELAQDALGWKRTTTYTVLKRLCDRGLFCNDGGTVRTVLSKQEFVSARSEQFVEETFAGSLPAFVAAFGQRKQLTEGEIEELQVLIDNMKRCSHG